jgi:hypothetical protein
MERCPIFMDDTHEMTGLGDVQRYR